MPWRTICPDPKTFRELTLEELLAEPVVRLLMAHHCVSEDDIRRIAREVRERLGRATAGHRQNAKHQCRFVVGGGLID
jgi:hypothetical protein